MALLARVEGEVAERALVALVVLVAGVRAGLALALLGVAVLAVGVVAAVAGEAAAAAAAGGGAVLVLGDVELGQGVLADGEGAFLGDDLVGVLVKSLDGHKLSFHRVFA